MKLIVIGIIALGVIGGIIYNLPATDVVFKERVVEVEKAVHPEWATDEDAVKAAQDVIRRKELEAELATLESEVKERETRITEIEKELGTY